ncbi:NUDIX hydrolase [Croceivirga thetidis]|uniref:NUDIX hydrolase n=1 Tax=Croceivirga thetidis TaxID=2721623 RepID=A0ABX1GPH4_9FLAO|nr:NUDIX domain-containing protein [Croceivirga thetidis]NKI31807.1 NUDIX hydrolase [Croceivirga thetidis]
MGIEKVLEYQGRDFLPNLSIDLVIIGYQEGALKCLLLNIADKWVLPGGHIKIEESVDTAVQRILKERTALEKPHFKFLSVFGDSNRNFLAEFKAFFEERGLPWQKDHWLAQRFVTLAYYSLVDIEQLSPKPGEFDEAVDWFSFDELPDMGLDHESIILKARNRLKEDIQREQLTYNLLQEEFTMPQLHRLHETILGEKLDRSRFQKKMLATNQFERLPKLKKETPGSNPYLYRRKN